MRTTCLFASVAVTALLIGCTVPYHVAEPPEGSYVLKQVLLQANGVSEQLQGALVTGEFFGRSQVLLGRVFHSTEYQPGRSAVVVVSHALWQRVFGADPRIVGTQIQVDGRSMIIVGITPPGFASQKAGQLWMPKAPAE